MTEQFTDTGATMNGGTGSSDAEESVDAVQQTDAEQNAAVAQVAETVRGADGQTLGAFNETPALEEDQSFLFPGDKGQLEYDARRVFALLLQRRFIEAAEDKWAWDAILKHQNLLESRFHDMFLELVVDREYGVAYKTQVRQEELSIPILLRDDSYRRAETVILIYLRSTFRQQVGMGEGAAFVDHDDLVNHAMSFFASDETNLALRQREVSQGIDQLAREGILKEASQERYRISPIIEVLMPLDRIQELTAWIEQRLAAGVTSVADDSEDDDLENDLVASVVVEEVGFDLEEAGVHEPLVELAGDNEAVGAGGKHAAGDVPNADEEPSVLDGLSGVDTSDAVDLQEVGD